MHEPPPNVLFIDAGPHDQLFRHASVVIHHGGAGTTGAVLASGRPAIVIPHLGDQYFFAREITRLGVGITLKRSNWTRKLAKAVTQVEDDMSMRDAARHLAQRIRKETPVADAISKVETLFTHRQSR